MGDSIEIQREGGHLFARGKQGRAEIFAESDGVFYSKAGPVKLAFAPGQTGATDGVLSLMGLREFRRRRLP